MLAMRFTITHSTGYAEHCLLICADEAEGWTIWQFRAAHQAYGKPITVPIFSAE